MGTSINELGNIRLIKDRYEESDIIIRTKLEKIEQEYKSKI